MTVLVTGANGQLGSAIRSLSASSPDRYVFTDVGELDICDGAAVDAFIGGEDVDVVVNCAAYTNVEGAEVEPAKADLLNHKAPAYIAEACRKHGAALIHISTDYVFEGSGNTPLGEDDEALPGNVYGRTKRDGERAVAASGCSCVIIRTSWLYGESGNNFLKTMMRLSAERERVKVVVDQTGGPTYAPDLASFIVRIITHRLWRGKEGIYNFSNEGVCSWYDFAYFIARKAGHTACRIEPCRSSEFPSKVKRPVYSVLDKTRVKEAFGIEIPHWTDSAEICIAKLKNENGTS